MGRMIHMLRGMFGPVYQALERAAPAADDASMGRTHHVPRGTCALAAELVRHEVVVEVQIRLVLIEGPATLETG